MKLKTFERDAITFEFSSGNVFADLGPPDADLCLARAELAYAIRLRIEEKGITRSVAATQFGTDEAEVSLVMNGRVGEFTLDRLIRFLNLLEMDATITVAPSADERNGTTVVVTTVARRIDPN